MNLSDILLTTVSPHAHHHNHHHMMNNHSMMNHSMMNHSTMNGTDHHLTHHVHSHTSGPPGVHHNGHEGMNHAGSMNHMGMMVYFHFSQNATILFEFWKTSTALGMFASCVAIFIFAALYEGLKVGREVLLRRYNLNYNPQLSIPVDDSRLPEQTHKIIRRKMFRLDHMCQTLLHILQIVMSYFLMLIFMTYNAWLCISVALGAGCGYFVFSWKRAVVVDINDHCH